MAKAKKDQKPAEIEILKLNEGRLTVHILGVTPLIYNSMSNKVWHELLLPRKKTKAEREATLKHNPPEEYRSSFYTHEKKDTLLCFPAVAFKRAMASAALDIGGAKRTQMDRLVWAIGEKISVYGVPQLRMDVTRSADMNRTPDIRTRGVLAEWACEISLAYVMPTITEKALANLLAAAGMIRGIGDFRQEKGAGNYGQFKLVGPKDKDYKRVIKTGARAAQVKAFNDPECYDQQSEEILAWWYEEAHRRGRLPEKPAPIQQ